MRYTNPRLYFTYFTRKLPSLILFRSSSKCSHGEITRVSDTKYVQYIRLCVRHSCCKPIMTIVSPRVLSTVINRVWCSELLFTTVIHCVDDAKVAGDRLGCLHNVKFLFYNWMLILCARKYGFIGSAAGWVYSIGDCCQTVYLWFSWNLAHMIYVK